jgi:hypothetical protein
MHSRILARSLTITVMATHVVGREVKSRCVLAQIPFVLINGAWMDAHALMVWRAGT